jgi:multimeric flavodoxin WrbA
MKVVVLHGSSRRGGDSDTLADRFLAGMGGEERHEVRHFYAIDMDVAHCRGCGTCGTAASPETCVIRDDMQEVYPAFSRADVVELASPMFWGYMTSQLKAVFDRLEAIASPRHFGGKDFVLFVTYRHYYGSMVEWLGRITAAFGSRMHAMTCQTYDPNTERDVPIANFPDRLEEAFQLGRKVAAGESSLRG